MKMILIIIVSFICILFLAYNTWDFFSHFKRNYDLIKIRIAKKEFRHIYNDILLYAFLYLMAIYYLWEKWFSNNK